jgi:SAM-dependent methyltransferase
VTSGDAAGPAARGWSARLAGWAVPREILRSVSRPPWYVPPDLLRAAHRSSPDTPSTGLARAALPEQGGSVLDVGCGGGRAGLALVPPAVHVTGVDRDSGLLEAFQVAARERRASFRAVHGDWPAVADDVEDADAVVCHHLLYNVGDLAGFALALHARARRRVVVEMRREHPMVALAPLWRQFWGVERPDGPTADDAVAVLREVGLPARRVGWLEPPPPRADTALFERQVELTRIRLCLPAERDPEVAAALRARGSPAPRDMVTIWWDRTDVQA